jgi:hypothetical protein
MSHFVNVKALAWLVALLSTLSFAAAAAQAAPDNGATEIEELDAGEAAQASGQEAQGEERLADEVLVETRDCIPVNRIRNTDILDDRRIVFYLYGSEMYLNRLPHRCPGLRSADAFSYDVRTSRLCNVDTISVLENFGGRIREGVRCGLGKFETIDEAQLALMREQDEEERKKRKEERKAKKDKQEDEQEDEQEDAAADGE